MRPAGRKPPRKNKGSNMRKIEMVTAGFIALAVQSLVVATAFI
jgi:hypothetical protein